MLKIEDIQSGKIYKNEDGELVYVLKILFEDIMKRHRESFTKGAGILPAFDYIVYRKLLQGRYDYTYKENYKQCVPFVEEVNLPVLFSTDYNRHYVPHDGHRYDIEFLCKAAYNKNDLFCQAKPYKFNYKLLVGQEITRDKSNFDIKNIDKLIDALSKVLTFQSFVWFEHVGPQMIGGFKTTLGYTIHFQTEEDYNLARLVLPIDFSDQT